MPDGSASGAVETTDADQGLRRVLGSSDQAGGRTSAESLDPGGSGASARYATISSIVERTVCAAAERGGNSG